MPFEFEPLQIPGVVLVRLRSFPDERGSFTELYKYSDFASAGIDDVFHQDNCSTSLRGVLRGLHYQKEPHAQAKLVRVVSGEVFDVVVDMRPGSATYGQWLALTLSSARPELLYVPAGFAHGFCVISAAADLSYKTTSEYSPEHDAGIIWNDPDLGIKWPLAEPILSPKDQTWPRLRSPQHQPA